MRISLMLSTVLSMAFAAGSERVDLCRLPNEPSKFSGKLVAVQGYVRPLMHGTYLKQEGCEQSLVLVLPDEIPNYKRAVKPVKDAAFESFEKARFNYQLDAPRYSATFVGEIEYAKRGKGFGYNKSHRVRLVLQAVQ